jgi:hypothetical protein
LVLKTYVEAFVGDGKWGMKIHEIICMPRPRTPKAPSAFDYATHKTKHDFVSYGP